MQTPFNMIVVGFTSCGKTHYLLRLLETEYKNQFENIFLLCPTFVHNKTYQEWKFVNDDDVIVVPCDQDEVECYLKKVTSYAEGTNSLIVIGQLCKLASRKEPNERTRQIRILGKALWFVNNCADSAINVDRKTVSRKHFKTRNVLQPEHQRHEHNLRRLSFDGRQVGKSANYLDAKKQRLG